MIGWPHQLSPTRLVFRRMATSRSGGVSISGSQQVTASNAGFWAATWEGPVHREEGTLAYRALYAALEGMAGEVLVPCVTRWRPRDQDGRMVPSSHVGSAIPSLHNLSGFDVEETPVMWVHATAARGASRLAVLHPGVPGVRPGHYFGIGDRLYLVSRTWQVDEEVPVATGGAMLFGADRMTFGGDTLVFGERAAIRVGQNISMIDFWPRLREAVAAATPLILGRPVCRMRLASDDTGALDQEHGIVGRPIVELVESI